MGPQFSFKTYHSQISVRSAHLQITLAHNMYASCSSCPLPGQVEVPQPQATSYHSVQTTPIKHRQGIIYPCSSEHVQAPPLSESLSPRPLSADSIELESAVLFPSHENLLSDLFQQPAELTSLHTSPIPMPLHPGSHSKEHGMESGSYSMERGKVY